MTCSKVPARNALAGQGGGLLDVGVDETVFEFGFATGDSIIEFAGQVGDGGLVVGIDISTEMVRITSQEVSDAGLSVRVGLVCGDAAHLPFVSNRSERSTGRSTTRLCASMA